ncbi:MAG: nitrate/sulfonate/bicarbonate ABC transporter ATP-binding protein [Candidatus Eremiobacteraeota bacterium]|nr:nitrate/sulfonate/bicarbonate ABC transporter ATP-binding protein [Candidatus Eremiobacteraeota bacterium]
MMLDDLIVCTDVTKTFPLPGSSGHFTALENVSLTVRRGEVLALLGRSGSGKSTLLRIMAGLIPPTAGTVTSDGKPVGGANDDVAMVFQSFALLPWLTVLENVEIGLEARGIGRSSRVRRALRAIDMVGLDGFEGAYPRELSGGMKQRVGCARAFVMEPKVLFMDEPFSALDVLTAENLRGEIDDLWNSKDFPSESILIVTHNIEEAALLADRVIVLGSNPGHIRGEVRIDLPRPHNRNDARFKSLVEHLYTVMTNPTADVFQRAGAAGIAQRGVSAFSKPLPHVRVGGISGLLEILAEQTGGSEDVSHLAERLSMSVDDLFAIIEGALILDFVRVDDGEVFLTPAGSEFATATILHSKELFQKHLLARVPLFNAIVRTLGEKRSGTMRADFFLDIWDEYFPREEAERQLATVVDWGRYAELFEYDAVEGSITLHEEAAATAS